MKLQFLTDPTLVCECGAGANVHDCAAEAMRLALEFDMAVEFRHNGKTYQADPKAWARTVLSPIITKP